MAYLNLNTHSVTKAISLPHQHVTLKKFGELYKHYPNCNVKFSKEPSFYFGAMYVSYAIGITFFIVTY